MSFTDGMDKTPGRRQNNRGWARLVRQQRHEEAVARNKAFIYRGRVSVRYILSDLAATENGG